MAHPSNKGYAGTKRKNSDNDTISQKAVPSSRISETSFIIEDGSASLSSISSENSFQPDEDYKSSSGRERRSYGSGSFSSSNSSENSFQPDEDYKSSSGRERRSYGSGSFSSSYEDFSKVNIPMKRRRLNKNDPKIPEVTSSLASSDLNNSYLKLENTPVTDKISAKDSALRHDKSFVKRLFNKGPKFQLENVQSINFTQLDDLREKLKGIIKLLNPPAIDTLFTHEDRLITFDALHYIEQDFIKINNIKPSFNNLLAIQEVREEVYRDFIISLYHEPKVLPALKKKVSRKISFESMSEVKANNEVLALERETPSPRIPKVKASAVGEAEVKANNEVLALER
ncbi:MAG: hypothetical protein K0Q51_983, partial [Rickettsiaceae bacterium]|nr:hypothetical protein [Rickettsiaceae bacterium]